jgi:hypothetical protein
MLSREGTARWTLRIAGVTRRSYRLQAALGALHRPWIPCAVSLSGRRLRKSAWHYDRASTVLRVRFSAHRAALLVSACRG